MNLYLTKKLSDKLKMDLSLDQPCGELYSWRANYVQGHGFKFVVFMNDASRLTIAINEAKAAKLKKLSLLFLETLRTNTFRALHQSRSGRPLLRRAWRDTLRQKR